jgi:diguanylate cyclase (GGDEF)-like protein
MKRSAKEAAKDAISAARLEALNLISDALDASDDGFAIWKAAKDKNGTVESFSLLLMNSTGAEAAGHPQEELIGKLLTEIVAVEESKGLHKLFVKALTLGHSVKETVSAEYPGSPPIAYENTVVPFGKDLVFATYRDVSESATERNRLLWLSEHDALTGIANRTKLQVSLEETVSRARKEGFLAGFVFIDIDHFKAVNDTYGHETGDDLLINFVKRVRNSLPESAFVARISGDEFAVVLERLRGEAHLRELLDEIFSSMQRPFRRGEIETSITCSAGCVLTDGTAPPEEIMRVADKTMYQAKFEGRNRYLVESIVQLT